MTQIITARAGWRGGFIVQPDRDELAPDVERPDRHTDRRGKKTKPAPAKAVAAERPEAERAAAAAHAVHVARCQSVYIEPPITNYGRTR